MHSTGFEQYLRFSRYLQTWFKRTQNVSFRNQYSETRNEYWSCSYYIVFHYVIRNPETANKMRTEIKGKDFISFFPSVLPSILQSFLPCLIPYFFLRRAGKRNFWVQHKNEFGGGGTPWAYLNWRCWCSKAYRQNMFDMKSETLPTLRGPCCVTGYVPSIRLHKNTRRKEREFTNKSLLEKGYLNLILCLGNIIPLCWSTNIDLYPDKHNIWTLYFHLFTFLQHVSVLIFYFHQEEEST